jgi:hypothetical protein
VDPEALVLLSLTLREDKWRLWDLAADWARVGSRFLSVQRMTNLVSAYPTSTRERLGEFASLALHDGKDHRWKKFVQPNRQIAPHREGVFATEPQLADAAAIMLRLRIGFGVGIKADVLSFLTGMKGAWITARLIARATHYTEAAVRRAADDMGKARLVHASRDTPTQYHVIPAAWKDLLELKDFPSWQHWQEVFAFMAHYLEWERELQHVGGYARVVRYREFLAQHRDAFVRNGISVDRLLEDSQAEEPSRFEHAVAELMTVAEAAV